MPSPTGHDKSMEPVILSIHGPVGVVTITRPNALNAIDMTVLELLDKCVHQLEADKKARVIVFTGSGKAFSAGGDIAAMRAMSRAAGQEFGERGHAFLNDIERSRLISIAAINGYALGGGAELALACDLRIGSTDAVIGFPEVRVGLFPGWGGSQRLARLIGAPRSKYLIFTGEHIGAQEALAMGLLNRVVDSDELIPTCMAVAGQICANSPLAVTQVKKAIVYGLEMPMAYALRLEIEAWLVNFASADRVEGLTAFLDKRKPHWKGE
jgi:enoyl-CoA hydratase